MNGKIMIAIRNLKKIYFDFNNIESITALEGVNLCVSENDFFSLVGPSGCGKSSLLYMMAGLLKPTQGEIYMEEQLVTHPTAEIGMVFQEWALLPWRTVAGNIELGLKFKKIPKKERKEIVEHFARIVGLEKFTDKYPRELSGGMKQRVGLARALANDPRVILFDEPFAAVDAQTRLDLQEELVRIWSEEKKTMIFVTHSVEEAVFLSNHVGMMTCRPGAIKEIADIDLPRPRIWREMQANPDFVEKRNYVMNKVREEVLAGKNESSTGGKP